jgi:3-isopropylmalate/(R)-2-methylmalate dehydratase small subunit
MKTLRGRVHKFGDHVDTDVIIPAPYLVTTNPQELAAHCMEGIDPNFASRAKPGDLIVAGRNFGCGSSREHAPLAIKGLGISCVIAASFARIFYRNALNIGLPVVECPEAADGLEDGDEVEVNLEQGTVRCLATGDKWAFAPLTGIAADLLAAGGLVPLVKKKLRLSDS